MQKNISNWWRVTPWRLVRARFLTSKHFDPTSFAKKHHLDVARFCRLYTGQQFSFWKELCVALSEETGLSQQFFENLSRNHHIMPPSNPAAVALSRSNRGSFN